MCDLFSSVAAHETRYEELQELLRSSKAALNAAEDQYKSSEDERATLNKQFADIQTQKNALVDEKQRLTHQAGKLEEEGNILHQQLVLLKQTKNFLELKVEQDRLVPITINIFPTDVFVGL